MMEPIAKFSKEQEGFSLIEILISLGILALVMLALLEAAMIYTQHNMQNILRDESVRVTQDVLYDLRSQDYTVIAATGTITAGECTCDDTDADGVCEAGEDSTGVTIKKAVRSAKWQFDACWDVAEDASQTRKNVTVVTSYTFLSQRYTHQASLVVIR